MDGITLSFTDTRPVLAPDALKEQVRAVAPLLAETATGEERHRDNLGWHSVDEAAGPERVDFLLRQAARMRADADAFVVIGIGGFNRASRTAVKALRPEGGPAILWAGNTISTCEMVRTLRELDGYQSIYINCIAKNFETLEPGIASRVLRQYLEQRYGVEGVAKRIFATGTPGSTPHQLRLGRGYTFLTFPETIGGRYSVGSDVGLFPTAVAGVGIRALVQGMRDMRDTLLAAPAEENPALRYACLRRLLLEHGYRLEMLSFFEPQLDYFTKWQIQLFAESEGKEGNALYPVAASNSGDLHSIGRFIQKGSPTLSETFAEVRARDASVFLPPEAKKGYFDYLTGMDFWDINNTVRQVTMWAHGSRGIPCMNLSIPAIDAHALGGLFYFFLLVCYLSCRLLGINPLSQPGVKGYKGYMSQNLGKPGVNWMKHTLLSLKRFDVPVELGRVNRLAPVAEWGRAIVAGTQQGPTGYDPAEAEFVDFFPETHLIPAAAARTADSRVEPGCQGIFRADTTAGGNFGAFTASRPAHAAAALGCGWVLISHCEECNDKAGILAEAGVTNTTVVNRLLNQEVKAAQATGLKVLYCIGEKSEEQEARQQMLGDQLAIGLDGTDKGRVVIAYEPIWSIGPGKTPANKPYIGKIARFVKERTDDLDVMYGGGFKTDNTAMLASIAGIDGGLIALTRFSGEIGFYPEEYLEIIRLCLGH